MPTLSHSEAQARLLMLFAALETSLGLRAYPELRCRVAEGVFRIPDVAVFEGKPAQETPETPPLAVIEIVSPDDRHSALIEKCDEYLRWGVRHIWIVDPQTRKLSVYGETGLHEVRSLEIAEFGISFSLAQVFE